MLMHRMMSDEERSKIAKSQNDVCDPVPLDKIRSKFWNLRPRDRSLEVGPDFRFQNRLQNERVLDTLTKQISN